MMQWKTVVLISCLRTATLTVSGGEAEIVDGKLVITADADMVAEVNYDIYVDYNMLVRRPICIFLWRIRADGICYFPESEETFI